MVNDYVRKMRTSLAFRWNWKCSIYNKIFKQYKVRIQKQFRTKCLYEKISKWKNLRIPKGVPYTWIYEKWHLSLAFLLKVLISPKSPHIKCQLSSPNKLWWHFQSAQSNQLERAGQSFLLPAFSPVAPNLFASRD